MIRISFFLLVLAYPSYMLADYVRLPAVYAVTGVASNDTLNVRASPDAGSADIGDLYPGQLVEITALDQNNRWARIIWGEGNGWISTRFLVPASVVSDSFSGMPLAMNCSGTEPFWSADIMPSGNLAFSTMGGMSISEPIESTTRSANTGEYAYAFSTSSFTVVLRREACSDGMSDRDYGWSLDMVDHRDGRLRLGSGCCAMTLP